MKSIRSGIVAATITTIMAAGTALAAQPPGAQRVNTQANPGAQQRLAYNSAEMPTTRTTYGAMGGTCPTPTISSSQPQHEVSNNGPPTFTPWLNITNGQ